MSKYLALFLLVIKIAALVQASTVTLRGSTTDLEKGSEFIDIGQYVCMVGCRKAGKGWGDCIGECNIVEKAICMAQCKSEGNTYLGCAAICLDPNNDESPLKLETNEVKEEISKDSSLDSNLNLLEDPDFNKFGDNICMVDCKKSGKKFGQCVRECNVIDKALCMRQCKKDNGSSLECAAKCLGGTEIENSWLERPSTLRRLMKKK